MYLESHPQTSVTVDIAASPQTLWPLISDIGTPALFSDELREAEWSTAGSPNGVGATFVGRNSSSRGYTWETRPTISCCDEPRLFEWRVGDVETPLATWSFEVTATPRGATLTHRVIFGTGVSPLRDAVERDPEHAEQVVTGRLVELHASMTKVVEGIKVLAEASS